MKKIIRLTESDLLRIIKKVIKEQESQDKKFDQFEYYFDKVNSSSTVENPIFIDMDTRDVYIYKEDSKLDNKDNKDKLEKLPYKIPNKNDIGFDEQNRPNQSLIDANKLHKKIDATTNSAISDVQYDEEKHFPIKIVFIDDDKDYDKIPKKGYIKPPSKNGNPPEPIPINVSFVVPREKN